MGVEPRFCQRPPAGFWWITQSQPELSLQCANLGEKGKKLIACFPEPPVYFCGEQCWGEHPQYSLTGYTDFSQHCCRRHLKATAQCKNMRWCFWSSFMDHQVAPPKTAPSSSVPSPLHPCPQLWQGEGVLTCHTHSGAGGDISRPAMAQPL